MKELVEVFTRQLADALEIGLQAKLTPSKKEVLNVVITGLGGSGIGGKIVAQLVAEECCVPILTNNTYDIPGFVNENTLVIASSFSGNTEETLFALEAAHQKGAQIAIISSGGKIIELAKERGYNHIILPPGDSPRAMLTYSLVQQFVLLHHYKLISNGFIHQLKSTISLLDNEIDSIKDEAMNIAGSLLNKTAVLYSEAKMEGVITRFRQQLNENSKVLCWHHVLPEMNHNELVGWAGGKDEYAVVMFRNKSDFNRTQVRMDITKSVVSKSTSTYIEVFSKGETAIENALYFILLGDWVSVYLAELKKVDPTEVKVISFLKGELSKI
jgi:glucose/mannose-6-phosphate isomerase